MLFLRFLCFFFFFFNDTATTEIYTLSLHDALPILLRRAFLERRRHLIEGIAELADLAGVRSEEHTSELQSPCNIVCLLLLEKKKKKKKKKKKQKKKKNGSKKKKKEKKQT